MDAAHWHRLKGILAQLLDLPLSQREDALKQLCGDDATLQREARAYLAAESKAAMFSKPAVSLDRPDSAFAEGDAVGPYQIVSKLAQGGMGEVYLAERSDGAYRGQVAIKTLRRGISDADIVRRFEAERQILAALNHPHIASLLDGGAAKDGLPFLAMEYVEGEDILTYCDSRRLTIAERLGLFGKVCSAVQYAHQSLVVHRDLKPGNILVTPEGEPKLLDFGIAKILAPDSVGSTATTQAGMRPMTPEYASPEQILGLPITTATDIYALGLLLFELLTGLRAHIFDKAQLSDFRRVVCEETPPKPSVAATDSMAERPDTERAPNAVERAAHRGTEPQRLRRLLAGDLDNIVHTALRKEPSRRYASAEQMARDVARHLAGFPVSARGDSWRYQAGKFIGRHRLGVVAACLAVLAVIFFTAALQVKNDRIAAERDEALRQKSRSEEVTRFMIDVFDNADPYQPGEEMTARELLARATERMQRGWDRHPALKADLMIALGQVNAKLGRFEEAEAFLREGLAIRAKSGDKLALAECLRHWGALLLAMGEYEPADKALSRASALAEERLGPRHAGLEPILASLSELRYLQGRYAEGERLVRRALSIQEADPETEPLAYGDNLGNLAIFLDTQGRFDEAETLYRKVLALQETALGPNHLILGNTVFNFAASLSDQARYPEAADLYLRAIDIYSQHLGPDHPFVGSAYSDLGVVHEKTGALDEAKRCFHAALTICDSSLGADHSECASILNNLGLVCLARSEQAQAVRLFEKAIAAFSASAGAEHPDVANMRTNLGRALCAMGRFEEAERQHLAALAIREKAFDESHPMAAVSRHCLGDLYLRQNRYDDAEALLKRALAIREAALGRDHATTAETAALLQRLLRETGREDEARAMARRRKTAASR